jgi:protein-tyrosine phosphatase
MQYKVLMVCLGNICRSPVAEGVLQHYANKAGLNWIVESAGTNGLHNGEAPHHISQKIAKQNGIDISQQISRQFVKADIKRYDKIYVMANDVMQDVKRIAKDDFDETKIDYFLNELNPGQNEDMPDPWYGGESGFVLVHNLIDKTCKAIVEKSLVNI